MASKLQSQLRSDEFRISSAILMSVAAAILIFLGLDTSGSKAPYVPAVTMEEKALIAKLATLEEKQLPPLDETIAALQAIDGGVFNIRVKASPVTASIPLLKRQQGQEEKKPGETRTIGDIPVMVDRLGEYADIEISILDDEMIQLPVFEKITRQMKGCVFVSGFKKDGSSLTIQARAYGRQIK